MVDYLMGVFGLTIVIIIGCITFWWFKENKAEKKKKGFPRGNSSWPLIGETLHFISSGYSSRPVSFMDDRKSLYGKVFTTHLLGKAVIVSTDPEVNKIILQNHGNIFIPSYPKTVTELLGKSSILQMNGALHKRIHALMGNFFKSPLLKARITKDIERSVQLALASWTSVPLVYIQDETKKITFEVLVRVLMSIEPGKDLDFLKKEYAEFIKGLICLPIKLPGTTLYKSLKAKERLLKLVRHIVEKRKMDMEETLSINKDDEKLNQPKDAVDALLWASTRTGDSNETAQQRLPLDFISDNIIEMMIPGEDSVPMAITVAVKLLSDSPIALNQLMKENVELKKKKIQSCEEYAWTDYVSLPFTQNVINETLRMANIVNAVWRKSLKDVEIKGYFIPQGCCVLASFSSVHMDEEVYDNPYEFNPWRWENRGSSSISSSFTPFGGGQRLCPGLEFSRLEMSIFLHHLVTTYRWVAEKDEIIYFPTVKMKRRLPITVTPINMVVDILHDPHKMKLP